MVVAYVLAALQSGVVSGLVMTNAGQPAAGVMVVARNGSAPVTHASQTGRDGRFRIRVDGPGPFTVQAHDPAWRSEPGEPVAPGASVRLTVTSHTGPARRYPSSQWLGLLPDGEEKRKFILDCTGCHQFNETRALKDSVPRSAEQWAMDVERMLRFAGAGSNFPVIAAERDPAATGRLVHPAVAAGWQARLGTGAVRAEGIATITEYDLPVAQDLPHDIAVDSSGSIVITGMFSHRMFVLDPATARVREETIPVPQANPRAVELDREGRWWVLLGNPRQVARFTPATREWKAFPIGMYPHSISVTPDGAAAWFNGHFTKKPILIGRLDAASGAVQQFEAPDHPELSQTGGPVPYEQRIAPDGTVWTSELIGNRLLAYHPATNRFETFTLPTAHSGPRRFDIAPDGRLWIPAYAANLLVEFDPRSKRFTEHRLPLPDAVPYITRVHPRTGDIWIGTAAADAILRFEPRSRRFTAYPVATRGATMRHMAIDPRTGAVWVAYGASPALHPSRIARLVPE